MAVEPAESPDAESPDGDEIEPLSFEDAFGIAERAAQRLERGDLTLEACLEEYQRGARGLRDCYRLLEDARRKLEVFDAESGLGTAGGDEEESSGWRAAAPDGPLADVLRRLGEEPGASGDSGGD